MTWTILNILFNLKIHKYANLCQSSNIKPTPFLCTYPLIGVLYHLFSINHNIRAWSTISSVHFFSLFLSFMERKLKECKTIHMHHAHRKTEQTVQRVPIYLLPPPPTHSLPQYQHPTPLWYICYNWWATLTYYHPKSIVSIMVQKLWVWQMYKDMYAPLWCHTE